VPGCECREAFGQAAQQDRPSDVVEIHPQWRGYDYIQVANEILIIDPGTREIVEIFQI